MEDVGGLDAVLLRWGDRAPPRLERRGRNRALERWCLHHFLRFRAQAGEIAFPLAVSEEENPDFVLSEAGVATGIEVTVAADPEEQRCWTEVARSGDVVSRVGERWVTGDRSAGLVAEALRRKAQKASARVDALLIYLNSHDPWFLAPEDLLSRLVASRPVEMERFRHVWVLRPGFLLECREGRLVFARDE